eukprot:CAMPEP_0116895910 /NCGR_PEP_ID=MMETSP0467-20121206/5298_1 /TAXON_ID=283647 /ORGANISM="Mesodinium pulex, Strain SPMC105" /LENGTH=146 /DNA_ID=CAMNT_0004566841 /DNA_START=838 /DNA_END=1278 /DNA_ORIENTATION=+
MTLYKRVCEENEKLKAINESNCSEKLNLESICSQLDSESDKLRNEVSNLKNESEYYKDNCQILADKSTDMNRQVTQMGNVIEDLKYHNENLRNENKMLKKKEGLGDSFNKSLNGSGLKDNNRDKENMDLRNELNAVYKKIDSIDTE